MKKTNNLSTVILIILSLVLVGILVSFIQAIPKYEPTELESFADRRIRWLLTLGHWDFPEMEEIVKDQFIDNTHSLFIEITKGFNIVFGENAHKEGEYTDFYHYWIQWKLWERHILLDDDSNDERGFERLRDYYPEWFDDDTSNDYENLNRDLRIW